MKPLILLHGAIGAADQLEPLKEIFSKNGFCTYTFSFSGHGKTPFQTEFGIEQFVIELTQFIEDKKLEKPDILGYSMGGYIALQLARTHSHLVGKIITLATKFEWTRETAHKEIKMLNAKTIEEKVPKFALALKDRHGNEWIKLLSSTAQMMISLGEHNLLNDDALAEIKNEVMLGVGDKDKMVSVEETLNVYRKISNGSFFVLPDTKHPIEGLDNKLMFEVALQFLNGNS